MILELPLLISERGRKGGRERKIDAALPEPTWAP